MHPHLYSVVELKNSEIKDFSRFLINLCTMTTFVVLLKYHVLDNKYEVKRIKMSTLLKFPIKVVE